MTRIKSKNTNMTEVLGYYNLSECADRKTVVNYLDNLAQECKIIWSHEDLDTIKIIDLDLDEKDIIDIAQFLSEYDVILDVSRDDDDYDSRDFDSDDYDDFGFGD